MRSRIFISDFSLASSPSLIFAFYTTLIILPTIKGRTIRKLIGGAGEVQKKYSRKGKLNEKKFVHAN